MTEAIDFFGDCFQQLRDLLHGIVLPVMGYNVSFWQLVIAFIVVSMVITAFWRGAKG